MPLSEKNNVINIQANNTSKMAKNIEDIPAEIYTN